MNERLQTHFQKPKSAFQGVFFGLDEGLKSAVGEAQCAAENNLQIGLEEGMAVMDQQARQIAQIASEAAKRPGLRVDPKSIAESLSDRLQRLEGAV